jgi:outer membrane receptor protein involved in Fe transport
LDTVEDENVVTASKREQTLEDVPISVSVIGSGDIQRGEIRDIIDLQSRVPSLQINQLNLSPQTNFVIRGFGNGANNVGIEPAVGFFVDGVYRSRVASSLTDFIDVDRVEVLRGPQSTLFGKNASAGVISVVTQDPSRTPGGSVEASYGNFNAFRVAGRALVVHLQRT